MDVVHESYPKHLVDRGMGVAPPGAHQDVGSGANLIKPKGLELSGQQKKKKKKKKNYLRDRNRKWLKLPAPREEEKRGEGQGTRRRGNKRRRRPQTSAGMRREK